MTFPKDSGRTELEERRDRGRDSDRKHHDEQRKRDALKRVSSVQLVSDIKKVARRKTELAELRGEKTQILKQMKD